MWKFKPFSQKEQPGLEGRFIDVGDIKVHVKNVIAEGGFSSVYSARDAANHSKLYALKHMICNDVESLDLVLKEISVMKSLKGHPNVVTLHAHTIFDMGRIREAILVMDFCEKSLVNVLESRGAGYFDEKQVLTIFRDICNAVFAMHCQCPPIAHRDLKAENLLLGLDGLWKLCDFGSTSTNHKCFEKPEEMGIEEDNIRKHTTPAYRAPEMWDLFRRDIISEKVDIWALGCLLFRICYFKSAFNGESKLQILNGNYRIPDLPKYSLHVTDLIRDMLQPSPESRPDITQVWFRVNDLLPAELQKSLPDRPPDMCEADSILHEGITKPGGKASVARRTPVAPSSSEAQTLPPAHASGGGASVGAFWSTQHAKDSLIIDEKMATKVNEETRNHSTMKVNPISREKNNLPRQTNAQGKDPIQASSRVDLWHGNKTLKETKSESSSTFQNEAFSTFVADFDTSKLSPGALINKSENIDPLEAEVARLKEQLRQANLEKAEISSKYEKLSAICRSQRQEIRELKQVVTARSPSPVKDALHYQPSTTPQRDKIEGTVWELEQVFFDKGSTNMDSKPWQAFVEDPNHQATSKSTMHSVRTTSGHQNRTSVPAKLGDDGWGFGSDSFSAVPAVGSMISKSTADDNNSQHFMDMNSSKSKSASQPAGWAGF